jgi:hypothetical protein
MSETVMKDSRLFTYLGIPTISVVAAGISIFLGKVMLDRGFSSTEAHFYLERAGAIFTSESNSLVQWLMGIPLLSYQPTLLFYPFAGDLAPVVASSVGLALCLAVLLNFARKRTDRTFWIPATLVLFLAHPSIFFTAITGSSFYLAALLTSGFVWSAAEWFNRRSDTGLYGMGLFWTSLILVNPGFVPLGLLMFPPILFTAINDELRKESTSINISTDGAEPKIASILTGDTPVSATNLRAAFHSTAAFLLIPGVVFVVYGLGRLIIATTTTAPWYDATFDLLSLGSAFSSMPESFGGLMSGLESDLPARLLVMLPIAALALYNMHDQPMKLYITTAPVLALFLTALGPINGFINAAPELIFIISVVTMLMLTPAATGWIRHLPVIISVVLSAFFGYQHLQHTTSTDLIAARSAFMFETSAPTGSLARFMENQTDEITFRIPSEAPDVSVADSTGIEGSNLEATSKDRSDDQTVAGAETRDRSDTPPPVHVPGEANRTPEQPPTLVTPPGARTPERPPTLVTPPGAAIPGAITWNDNDRYYFEVRITANTGTSATRNYLQWRERAGSENVTLLPQYREGRIIRWLIGTDRYDTFRTAVAGIEADRGSAAVNNAFVTLYHLTDFRIFGDAPNYDPSVPGFTLLLGTFDSRARALEAQQHWQTAGLDQTRIASASNRYELLTGRYNEEAEAELLALVIRQKSGQIVQVVALP